MTRSRSMITNKQRTNPPPPAETGATRAVTSLESERLIGRLAEMVSRLSDCELGMATDAVRAILGAGQHLDALEVVAMALIAVESRQRGQLRVPGYVRPEEPDRSLSARRAARRARRTPAPAPTPTQPPEPPDAVIVDLRSERAQLQLDLTRPEAGGSSVS
jgi:hypothetical protein